MSREIERMDERMYLDKANESRLDENAEIISPDVARQGLYARIAELESETANQEKVIDVLRETIAKLVRDPYAEKQKLSAFAENVLCDKHVHAANKLVEDGVCPLCERDEARKNMRVMRDAPNYDQFKTLLRVAMHNHDLRELFKMANATKRQMKRERDVAIADYANAVDQSSKYRSWHKEAISQRDAANERADKAKADARELYQALLVARVEMQAWGNYASLYFREKWDLDGDLEKAQQVLDKHAKYLDAGGEK